MKRLVFRISALVTLVVLGAIAIAEAQRGPGQAGPSDLPAAAIAPVGGDAVGPPILTPANPTPLPISEKAPAAPAPFNPMRAPARADQVLSVEVAESDAPAAAGAAEPTAGKPTRAPVDPFAAQAARSEAARVAGQSVEPAPRQAAVLPPLPTQDAKPNPLLPNPAAGNNELAGVPPKVSDGADRYTASQRALETNNGATGTRDLGAGAAAPALQGPNPSPRYAPARRPSADGAEPAPLSLDPAAPPTKILGNQALPELAPPTGPAPSEATSTFEGSGQPGTKQLEGPQSPQLTIQKFAPEGIQVGKAATFRVTVTNSGQAVAHGVEVRDTVPKGTQLVATKPRASRGANGDLVWDLGTVKPGDDVSVEMQVLPVAEGEIGSVATVRFHADASARTIATKPQLVVKSSAPNKVLIGEQVLLTITVANPGTGVATGVVLEEHVPPGLQHPTGAELDYEIGPLKPGESRQLQLPLSAVRAGPVTNLLMVKDDGSLKAEDRLQLQVVAPQLDLSMEGPKRRYLERQAVYTVMISNPGTAPARQVELVAHLPRGLKFVSANNSGQYQAATQSVHWLLEELPANDADKVELVTLPIEAGEQKIRLQGRAEKGLSVEREQPVNVEGIAAVLFEVTDVNDPIEVGGETTYEIRVLNQGSKAATNVRITALFPPGMRAVAAEGPTRQMLEPNRVQFESLARLAPKADTTYRVRVQGLQPGDLRVRVQLLTDEMQEPVTKEESTRVYRDE